MADGGYTALRLAIQLERLDVVKALVEAGTRTDVTPINPDGKTLRQVAENLGYVDILLYLLETNIP